MKCGHASLSRHRGVLMMSSDDSFDGTSVLVVDPTGRFERHPDLIGEGAYKKVYRAYDIEEGIEVAWNQVHFSTDLGKDSSAILSEIKILQSLKNDNIINIYHVWLENGNEGTDLFFITELMTSGAISSYVRRTKIPIKTKVIKSWFRQILSGLDYLHGRNPPIIHRDLKCENIFISGNNGRLKIGDLGLAVAKTGEHLTAVIGTPEFMAPELYDEKYDEKVDIYAFGMVALELYTREYPYSECENSAQIYKKVINKIAPRSLLKILDKDVKDFIMLCISHRPEDRPTARELLSHDFLKIEDEGDNTFEIKNNTSDEIQDKNNGKNCVWTKIEEISSTLKDMHPQSDTSSAENEKQKSPGTPPNDCPDIRAHSFCVNECSPDLDSQKVSVLRNYTRFSANVTNIGDGLLEVFVSCYVGDLLDKTIKFPYNISDDSPDSVIMEMVREELIDPSNVEQIRNALLAVSRRVNDSSKHCSNNMDEYACIFQTATLKSSEAEDKSTLVRNGPCDRTSSEYSTLMKELIGTLSCSTLDSERVCTSVDKSNEKEVNTIPHLSHSLSSPELISPRTKDECSASHWRNFKFTRKHFSSWKERSLMSEISGMIKELSHYKCKVLYPISKMSKKVGPSPPRNKETLREDRSK